MEIIATSGFLALNCDGVTVARGTCRRGATPRDPIHMEPCPGPGVWSRTAATRQNRTLTDAARPDGETMSKAQSVGSHVDSPVSDGTQGWPQEFTRTDREGRYVYDGVALDGASLVPAGLLLPNDAEGSQ